MQNNNTTNLFTKLTQIKPSEIKGALVSFIFLFILMASYMIVKPVRDALPSDWGNVGLAQQWSYTFIVATIAVSIYNFCASKIPVKRLVPGVFVFFAFTFILIYLANKLNIGTAYLGKIFYVWSSVFSLFHISVFWSYISQQYSKEDSKRVFGFINVGASIGAISGPLLIILLPKQISVENILLITSGALFITLPLLAYLNQYFSKNDSQTEQKLSLNSNPFSGFQEFITHKKLLGIAAFIFMFTGFSAFIYTAQTELLSAFPKNERKALLGSVELATNILTIIIGIFATNRISRKFGMKTSLSIVPFILVGLILLLSINPAVMFVLALQVVRRSGNYAITRPAREILFTAVDREARFKTKPIIDVAIYRGGDVFWIWIIAFLGDGYLNLGITTILLIAAVVVLLWGFLGIYLGKKHDETDSPTPTT